MRINIVLVFFVSGLLLFTQVLSKGEYNNGKRKS